MKKKGALPVVTILLLVLVAGVGYVILNDSKGGDNTLSIDLSGDNEDNGDSDGGVGCDGIASIKDLYNDIDYYKAGTDPASHITYTSRDGKEFSKAIADDATSSTLGVNSLFKGVAGTNLGTPKAGYFSEVVEFQTGCSDEDHLVKLRPAGSATLTVVNSNGVTVNADAADEALGASTTKTFTIKMVAPSEACAMRHGGKFFIDYDATYYNQFSSSDMDKGSAVVTYGHNTTGNAQAGTNDQWEVFEVEGELCDGDDAEYKLTAQTTSTQPTEDINIDVYFVANDIDVDADTNEILDPDWVDEDRNIIGEAIVNATIYVQ